MWSPVSLTAAAIFGASAVGLGAFAAHGLRATLTERSLAIFQIGVTYQFYHALALLALGLLLGQKATAWWNAAGVLWCLGVVLFSGSLYGLALTSQTWFGPITPLGGLCFILGWVCLAIGVWR